MFSSCVVCLYNPLPVSGLLLTRSGKHDKGSRPAKAGKMRSDALACFCVALICAICIAIASDCQSCSGDDSRSDELLDLRRGDNDEKGLL